MEELARRAVACKGWRWMPGMLTVSRMRVTGSDRTDVLALRGREVLPVGPHSLPDLDDPATLGCLLKLVREAYRLRLWLAASRDGDMCLRFQNASRL